MADAYEIESSTKCETCGQTDDVIRILQDTAFCSPCWEDFRGGRWKGIGSKLGSQAPSSEQKVK